ncbi:hypothetical protein LAZ67_16000044 [Cordylochernes scorpioides]|uniref:Band 7 domain-containing protein n=1 Tax=Cordylochernes scorpioides TaxID=51811 RepID=A0ABY6LAB0_9ARAC|nr:hypothetical protein LAZ67_16000044 [Cordylochernes scorpioides]
MLCLPVITADLGSQLVHDYERAVLFKLGKMQGKDAKGPGVYFTVPCIDTFVKMDLRTTSLDIPPQEVLTRDAVTLSVDAVVYYRVTEPTAAVGGVRHLAQSVRLVAGTSLRSAMGVRELQDLLSDRQSAAKATQVPDLVPHLYSDNMSRDG